MESGAKRISLDERRGSESSLLRVEDTQIRELLDLIQGFGPHYTSWVVPALRYYKAGAIQAGDFMGLLLHVCNMHEHQRKPIYNILKRGMDIVGALALIVILGPLMLLIGLVVKLDSDGHVFYTQLRAGRHGQLFWIYKFRTMHNNAHLVKAEQCGHPLHKPHVDPRVTRLGSFLRKFKLDELPQLFNVLGGDMSLVGPRPLSLDDNLSVSWAYISRLAVRPGLTGLWQAYYPTWISSRHKMRLDVRYVRRRSFLLDLFLVLRTPFILLKSESQNQGKMRYFRRSRKAA